METLSDKLNHYMDAGFPILWLETFEEAKADRIIAQAARNQNFSVIECNARGLFFTATGERTKNDLSTALNNFIESPPMAKEKFDLNRKILVIKDATKKLEQSDAASRLKYLAELITSGELDARIIIVAPLVVLPKEIEHLITLLSMDYPTESEISALIKNFCEQMGLPTPRQDLLQRLVDAFKGMPEFEIRNVLALAVAENGAIAEQDLSLIHEQKKQIVQKSGVLEMIEVEKNFFAETGGLENLKRYLMRKQKIFSNMTAAEKFGVDRPKGVLIAGLPGCGKSLSVKAAASLFKIPLIQLDMGRLMGKYVGESEANLRRAIKQADAIAPCILWLDELEKAFAGVGGQGVNAELTTRLMGTFLTWMQEKKSLTFVIATLNTIKNIPPEFLRRGRFDEVFYVDLPSEDERTEILRIHIGRRRPNDLPRIDLQKIAQMTDGFSGADLEGVVKDTVEETFNQELSTLTDDALIDAVNQTHPLSETMRDEIAEMRDDYAKRSFKNAS
ncbi:MAG: AAA family ATPase [Selenomonadaceae bacterium]|nr:AAA family ATPase [Selenomonadaceae bacterium]